MYLVSILIDSVCCKRDISKKNDAKIVKNTMLGAHNSLLLRNIVIQFTKRV